MRWIWDEKKNAANKRKHGLTFEAASFVFDDPLASSRRDSEPREERWQTIGMVGHILVFVVHCGPTVNNDGEEIVRIISARKANPRERRDYEEDNF